MTKNKIIRVLVLAQNYPDNNGGVSLAYIHTRNLYYRENNVDVTVLNFSARNDYVKEGISVITRNTYATSSEQYDLLILHAANLRSHFKFLLKYGNRFNHYLFFYHGHEVMRINHDYPIPYRYMKSSLVRRFWREYYDELKLFIWKCYLPHVLYKSYLIFVSKWMHDIFTQNTQIPEYEIKGRYSITYNGVAREFETLSYNDITKKEFDFITIRANIDGSKYAVDIVNRIAQNTPNATFLLIGKGGLFSHIKKADNLIWYETTLNHSQIIELLNRSRFALMPTRTDAQGLMMCEMAAFGIPVITSDIDICHEVFDGFENVYYIDNDADLSLSGFLRKESRCIKDTRYFWTNTLAHELEVIEKLVNMPVT